MKQDKRRILIVRTDRIGDVILTLPMAQALRRYNAQLHIAMLIRRYTADLVNGNPDVDQVLYYDNEHGPLPFFQLVASLRKLQLDAVINTYPRFRLALMMWFAGIPIRIGTGYRWYSFLFNRKVYEHRKDAQQHELEYNLNLLKALDPGIETERCAPSLRVEPATVEHVRNFLQRQGVEVNDTLIILHPGSGGSAREWSASKFKELGKRLAERDHVSLIITGGKHEGSLVNDTAHSIGVNAVAIAGTLSLREYAALIKLSSLFIANSTGPLHIAAAVGTPVIGLYSQITSLSSNRWSPVTECKIIFTPKGKPIDCTVCSHGHALCECMESITVDEVLEAATTLIENKKQ